MSAILLIGEDEFLLETRAAVIRPIGAETVCTDVASAISFMESHPFDVAVLCHSIPDHLRKTLTAIIRQSWPATRILLVSPSGNWEDQAADGIEVCPPNPERLIERTVELLGRRKAGSVRSSEAGISDRHIVGR